VLTYASIIFGNMLASVNSVNSVNLSISLFSVSTIYAVVFYIPFSEH